MKGVLEQLSIAATLAICLATAGSASAADAPVATQRAGKASGPLLALSGAALSAYVPQLQMSPPPVPSANPPSAAHVRRLLTEQAPAPECKKSCDTRKTAPVIADELLDQLGTVPVLGTVMVPVTRGVMISTGEGTPPLKLAVMPTQIRRGSGLVAIGRF